MYYLDTRDIDNIAGQITNIKSIELRPLGLFVLHHEDTSYVTYLLSSDYRYIGMGEMEDLNLGIHIPETLLLR